MVHITTILSTPQRPGSASALFPSYHSISLSQSAGEREGLGGSRCVLYLACTFQRHFQPLYTEILSPAVGFLLNPTCSAICCRFPFYFPISLQTKSPSRTPDSSSNASTIVVPFSSTTPTTMVTTLL